MYFETDRENCKRLKAAAALGVTVPLNWASIASGRKGVPVMVGVKLMAGVGVMVGVSVIVGVRLIVGVMEIVGVGEGVVLGGK